MKASNFDLKEIVTDNRLRGLWRMMTGFRLIYVIAAACLGIAALAQTGSYYLLQYFVDTVLQDETLLRTTWLIAAGFVVLASIQGTLTFLGGRLAARTAEGITVRLRDYLYDHLQRLTFTYHDNMQTGELLQRATSDVDTLRRLFAEQAIGIGRITLLFIVNFIALLLLDVRLAFYSVAIIPIVLVISLFFFVKVGKAYETYQDQDAAVSSHLQENLTGVRVVKAFARQAYEKDRFDEKSWEKFLRGRRLAFMHATYWPITDILCGLQMVTGFFLAARMAILGTITPGTYLAYVGFLIQIIWPIRNLGRLVAQMSTGFVSLDRVKEIIRQFREPLDKGTYLPEGKLQGAIRIENVTFAYEGEEPVLHNISFEAKPGQVVALLGATGSGKTTLVNLLPRFYEYTNGRITLDDVELKEYPRSFLRQQIGVVQQEPFLFSRSIRDNITYGVGRVVTDEELFTAARAAAVHDVIESFPEGYKTMVGERGVTLSGGQKQRVTLARTLLKNPRILILDDATSSVDTETEAEIREALNSLMAERTTFVIAHRIQSVMNADLILVLDHGHIVQRGTHEELVNQPGIYRRTYDVQARIEEELEDEIAAVMTTNNGQANDHKNGKTNGYSNGRHVKELAGELETGD
ncbi:MAG: ABC transporter ATP-binding protein [Ardenticatenaceae bacterium]|nr:ABC transporter ATP-binding protein [Ardenticatenaceae bacterium]